MAWRCLAPLTYFNWNFGNKLQLNLSEFCIIPEISPQKINELDGKTGFEQQYAHVFVFELVR